ncbi:MAG: S-adenosylmethionine synthase [Microgenomates group bacterium GW2011_GWC1_44_37]|uniref:Methionine adenosyltransferase n=1 Tax=Candidatus Collierbacteria bacterium GW2011_GWB2_44_22 TaxID=1618387 RepID=A0A0G1I0X6_9BACT|nr:MAG: S-adenosylmethionine synthase [Candidatus Collierbacteria bacterium GW2011_GWA2_44_13]KKT48605.1 MAG: S-adenosylmethionine synthase [Candidatus Collierbacteria bacterium GW2011_GWB1_44_197]KKT52473.1 MAG: S-adenosylmethionine synthase [Candidatus Collierbacteria bacterium GW2011_GWB2_44_22]KKT62696.1 MAG: S-adenosylmethionine synthase [Candidatus Collierbacteria bacterium GW2011_GWD1_44_27]KKT65544.1 MAG: S-adenosylmethionine synthase [Candidatus Collierbacteria bacterium GW2011_GWC2_44
MKYSLFSSESVCAGHPDKICDQISDAVLDAAILANSHSRVACESLVTTDKLVLAGEITCPRPLDYRSLAQKVIQELGYTRDEYHFGPKTDIEVYIHEQSKDIAVGVDEGGAGDQGMMFGYATTETSQLMPLPITLAHELVESMDLLFVKELPFLRPDGKSQVTVKYENGRPASVEKIVLAKPQDPTMAREEIKEYLYKLSIVPILEKYHLPQVSIKNVIFNGTGAWEIGGPASDTGVTGRKIVVDTYGGMGRIGGGCFSGKDLTKVDRSGAYAARFIAKNIVAAKLADRCEVQLAYAIGVKDPVGKAIETYSTNKKGQKVIEDFAWNLLDLSVAGIISGLDLLQPIYQKTSRYGHFGHPEYPWERLIG